MGMEHIIILLTSALALLNIVNSNPNLPQPVIDNARNTANYAISYARSQLATTSQPVNTVVQPVDTPVAIPVFSGKISSMKPQYTYDELINLFNSNVKKAGLKQQYLYNRFPVTIQNLTSTSADLSQDGYYMNFGKIKVNGVEYDKVELKDLTPDTTYDYEFIFKEDGREDTIIQRTFKTPAV